MNQPFKQLQYGSKESWQSVASLDSWCNSQFSIPAQTKNQESRTSYRESSWGSSLEGQKTKYQPMTDFSIILQRHTAVTQHSMVKFTQAVKWMFHPGHQSVSSFISSSKVSNACSKCKQCIFVYKPPGDSSHIKGAGMHVRNFELNP